MNKSFANNVVWNLTYKAISIIVPMVFSIYSSRIFMADGVGRIAYAQNIANYFIIIAPLGVPNYGTKKIGSFQNDSRGINRTFSELFSINLFSSILAASIYYISVINIGWFIEKKLLLIFGIQIIFNVLNIDWLYQGLEEYKYIAIRGIIVKFVCIISLLTFVHNETDIYKYTFILCFSTVGNSLFNIVRVRKHVKFLFHGLNISQHYRIIFILLASTFATEIYTLLDTTMIGIFCTEADVGYYSNSSKIVRIVFSIIMAICAVYFPRLSLFYKARKMDQFANLANLGLKVALFISIPFSIGFFVLSDNFIFLLFGKSFYPGANTLRILAILVIIFSIAYISGHVLLMSMNLEKMILIATIVGACINFSLNYVLIQLWKYNGAALASVIAESIVTIILLRSSMKIVKLEIDKYFILSTLIPSFILVAVLLGIKQFISNNTIVVFSSIIVGAIVYGFTSLICRNEIGISIYNKSKDFLHITFNVT